MIDTAASCVTHSSDEKTVHLPFNTSNVSKTYVTRDSSGPGTLAIYVDLQQ